MKTWIRLFGVLCLGVVLGACDSSREGTTAQKASSPRDISTQECAACGMVVREQPAPRGQLVHSDGSRAFFCSLGDMAQYMAAPSPHGGPETVFVEVLDPALPPSETASDARPWLDASRAFYVLGVPRSGIMGPPVLAYPTHTGASAIAEESGGYVADFSTMRARVIDGSLHAPE